MTQKKKPDRTTLAAALVIQALKRRNRLTGKQLKAVLKTKDISPHTLPDAVRLIRDRYGANALVTTGTRPGRLAAQYVLDPDLAEGEAWARQMSKRGRAEARHVGEVLDWLALTYGNRGVVRRARRYAKNLLEELDELIEELQPNGR